MWHIFGVICLFEKFKFDGASLKVKELFIWEMVLCLFEKFKFDVASLKVKIEVLNKTPLSWQMQKEY